MSDNDMMVLRAAASFHRKSMSDNDVPLDTFSLPSDAMSNVQLSLE